MLLDSSAACRHGDKLIAIAESFDMPDLLFHGGPIYTLDPARRRVDALLVRDDRIVVVETEAEETKALPVLGFITTIICKHFCKSGI